LVILSFPVKTAFAEDRPAIPRAGQLLLGIAPDWSSTKGTLYPFHRDEKGNWVASFQKPVPVLFGRGGLVWGRGAVPVEAKTRKTEGDRKAPAGFFAIGKVFGYEKGLPQGSDATYPYRQVTRWDAWPDDPRNPSYNRHVVIDPANGVPAWFEKQKMRLGDDAYHWLIEVRHNSDPKPVPGGGSAIFFHTRRGVDTPSHGCTVMARGDLENVLCWLRTEARPHYVLLPKAEYLRLREAWNLPVVNF
jgi:L,D-peptidoglycan transpeptidase YkuD (ErfK/YbiS/YcfS/YnhG family)